ncbi:unnamed protein product, partial [Adineta ricciae]
ADGHTYERSAIVRWVNEHGTSPLTRQPLNVDELQPDDYLRVLAAQRRKSIESNDYDIQLDQVAHQNTNSLITHNYNLNNNLIISTQEQTLPNYALVSTYSIRHRNAPESSSCYRSGCLAMIVGTLVLVHLLMFFYGMVSAYSRYLPVNLYFSNLIRYFST